MKSMKKFLSLLAAITLISTLMIPAFAAPGGGYDGYVVISADANVLGAGFLYEPARVGFYKGESVADITERFLGAGNVDASTHPEYGYFLNGFKLPFNITVEIPADVAARLDELIDRYDNYEDYGYDYAYLSTDGHSAAGEILGGGDFFDLVLTASEEPMFNIYAGSGWMFSLNNASPVWGAAEAYPKNGDVIRWQFSLLYGDDIGLGYGYLWHNNPTADKDALTAAVAAVNAASNKSALLADPEVLSAYSAAYAVLGDLRSAQTSVDGSLTALNGAVEAFNAATDPGTEPVDPVTPGVNFFAKIMSFFRSFFQRLLEFVFGLFY